MFPKNENEQSDNEDKYKNDGFARTSWVIPKRDFDFDAHDWSQEGTLLICSSCQRKHTSSIPVNKMLIKTEEGKYDIVPVPVLA